MDCDRMGDVSHVTSAIEPGSVLLRSPKHAATRPLPFQPDGPKPASNPVLLMIGHLVYLARATAIVWWRQAPWLLGLMLFSVTAQYTSLLVTSRVVRDYPFFIMFGLSFGILVNMAMVILAIRYVGDYLGNHGNQPRPSIRNLLGATVIPFMVIYMAFGYVSDFTSSILYVLQVQVGDFSLADILGALNPLRSTKALVETVIVFAVTFLLGYLMNWLGKKTTKSWPSLISAFLSTVRWVLGFFSLFRIWEQVHLWFYDRQFTQWWQQFLDWLSSLVHINFPQILSDIWAFFTTYVWHGMWTLLIYPLVWFALVIVVAGGQFLSVNDVYDRVMHVEQRGAASFFRREIIDRLPGDLDSRFFPILHALRETTRATLPFLGAFVLSFTLLTWAGDGLTRLAAILIGARPENVAVALLPFVSLISSLFVMSLQIALLGVAFQRASQLAQMPARPRGTTVRHGVAVALACAVLVTAQGVMTPQGLGITVHTVPLGSTAKTMDATTMVSDVRVGKTLDGYFRQTTTDRLFLAVTVTVQSDTQTRTFYATVNANGHTYQPYRYDPTPTTTPGFRTHVDYVFEIVPADLDGPVFVDVKESVSVYLQQEISRFSVDKSLLANISDEPITVNDTSQVEVP